MIPIAPVPVTTGTEAVATPRVAVVIPFFQRRPGLLRRAVLSALGQGIPVLVMVVDDSSPLDPTGELAGLGGAEVVVIRQANAGPGAARNRGIEALPPHVEYVAFLDSDDAWHPSHLSRALSALDSGADVYFSDFVPVGQSDSTFSLCRFPDKAVEACGNGLFAYPGDLFDALLRRSPVGTSTVVYRRSISDRAFPVGFHYGEDVFFWMSLACAAKRIMFSDRLEADYGPGVNIAASASWGGPTILPKLRSEYLFHREVARSFDLTADQLAWSQEYRIELFRSFRANFVHRVLRRSEVNWRDAVSLAATESIRRARLMLP